jgi:hypothetical protein
MEEEEDGGGGGGAPSDSEVCGTVGNVEGGFTAEGASGISCFLSDF